MQYLSAELATSLQSVRRRWLVTGAAGFIGSHLVECLLQHGQVVVGFDNFATGYQANLDEALAGVDGEGQHCFSFVPGDLRDPADCVAAIAGVDVILHQAALGSVPRSIVDPLTTHAVNVDGFLNLLDAARQANVERFIYAASSSTYGDEPSLPKIEERIGSPLSPYAVTKLVNELYARVYALSYGYKATGLRYFNVFGPRQDPDGAYAAVIPRWIVAMKRNDQIEIFGDGKTSRDFCFIANVVQANIRAALGSDAVQGEVFNVAAGDRTDLVTLFEMIRDGLFANGLHGCPDPAFADFRQGDVRHSEADIGKARKYLGYDPTHSVEQGLAQSIQWYVDH
jgi:UDP-N-acetylglucosamine 4-epimerase